MKKLLAIVLALAMVLSLTACGGNGGSGEKTLTEDGKLSSLTTAVSSEIQNLLPSNGNGNPKAQFYWNIYESLFTYNKNLEFAPCLAKSWEAVDSTHWNIFLYEKIYDSAGNHITADDVVFSFNWLINAGESLNFDIFKGITAVDEYTVQIEWTQTPTSAADIEFPLTRTYIFDSEAFNEQTFATAPIATGNYVVKSFVTGSELVLEANPNYWADKTDEDVSGRLALHNATVQTLTYRIIQGSDTAEIELEMGNIDYCDYIKYLSLEKFQNNDKYVVSVEVASDYAFMGYNMDPSSPLAEDLNLRLATLCGGNGLLHGLPVHHIGTDQVAPADIAPIGAGHILLEEQMVHTVIVHRGMGLVHPELVGSAVELGAGIVTGEQILEPDFLEFNLGNLGLFVTGSNFLAAEGAGIELHIIQVAADRVQESGSEPLALTASAHDQGSVPGVGNLRTCGNRAGCHQLAIQVQAHFAHIRVKGRGHVVPLVFLQIVTIRPNGEPFISGAHLEGKTAVTLVAQQEALFVLLVHLADDAGELVVSIVGGIGVVPLEGSGRNPDADGQRGAGDFHVIFVVGDISGAVEEQAAVLNTVFAPLGILAVGVGGVGQMIVQLHILQITGGIGNHQALTFVQLQMHQQVSFVRIGISEYHKCGHACCQNSDGQSNDQDFLFHKIPSFGRIIRRVGS